MQIHFNTSYVTVQQKGVPEKEIAFIQFQYILCYGSTIRNIRGILSNHHFNTSYVTVQRRRYRWNNRHYKNFNTSYVTVQPSNLLILEGFFCYFNTSYVTVQRLIF